MQFRLQHSVGGMLYLMPGCPRAASRAMEQPLREGVVARAAAPIGMLLCTAAIQPPQPKLPVHMKYARWKRLANAHALRCMGHGIHSTVAPATYH